MNIFWQTIKYAFSESVSRSGARAPVVGTLALLGILRVSGYQIAAPTTLLGGVVLFVMCAVLAGILVILARFLYAPYHFLAQANAKVAMLERNQVVDFGALVNMAAGYSREITDGEEYDILETDSMVVVRRTASSFVTLRLPKNPHSGKNIDIARSQSDLSGYVLVDGNGRNIVGAPTYTLPFAGQSITVRYSGTEWVIT